MGLICGTDPWVVAGLWSDSCSSGRELGSEEGEVETLVEDGEREEVTTAWAGGNVRQKALLLKWVSSRRKSFSHLGHLAFILFVAAFLLVFCERYGV